MNKQDQIAIFKYGLLAPVIHDTTMNKNRYFKELAQKEYQFPGKPGYTKFQWRTFKKWLHLYRTAGYEGLKPSVRKDRGKTRKIEAKVHRKIQALCTEYRFKTVSNLYRHLIAETIIAPHDFTEVTLRNFLRKNQIKLESKEKIPRKAFEVPHINMLWTTDFMHGPYVKAGKKKMKAYLCCIIDDHSRLITGGSFHLTESSSALEKTLKDAVLTYGVPLKLYCDNGKVFTSGYIHMVCAKLGIALIHSKPYDSPSRGKIERFFKTVRDMFLPTIPYNEMLTLDTLNQFFTQWIAVQYHQNLHRGINEKPMDRYLNDMTNIKIRQITPQEADYYFFHTIYRTVHNDCTIAFQKELYEVPSRYIGKKIEIRFPLENPSDLRVYEENKQTAVLKKLDKNFNSENTIRYSTEEQQDV